MHSGADSTGYVKSLVRASTQRSYEQSLRRVAAELLAGLYAGPRIDEPLPPLMEFIPSTSPHLRAPTWLAPMVDVVERAAHEPVRVVTSVPPQHGKSETLLHALARHVK